MFTARERDSLSQLFVDHKTWIRQEREREREHLYYSLLFYIYNFLYSKSDSISLSHSEKREFLEFCKSQVELVGFRRRRIGIASIMNVQQCFYFQLKHEKGEGEKRMFACLFVDCLKGSGMLKSDNFSLPHILSRFFFLT